MADGLPFRGSGTASMLGFARHANPLSTSPLVPAILIGRFGRFFQGGRALGSAMAARRSAQVGKTI
jgi:hypothetical protein